MPDLSSFGTPAATAPPPPAAAPASGGGLSQFGTPDLSSFGTPADTGPQSPWWKPEIDEGNSEPGDVHFKNPLIESASQAVQSIGASALDIPATIGTVAHRIGGNIIGNSGPITDALVEASDMKRDSVSAKAGQVFETMAEWMVGEGELKALTQSERMAKLAPVVKMLERYPKLSEAALAHPEVVKYLPDALRQGIIGASQTAAHGGSASDSLESGAVAGSLGLAAPMIGGALFGKAAQAAEKIQPTVRDLMGAKYTELAGEARGPNGELLNPDAVKAADIARQPGIQAERQGAFKELQTNLAQTGLENHLNAANDAMAQSGVAPAIQRTMAGDWRYIPPNGAASLSEPEARSTMEGMKQLWLDKEWAPGQEGQIGQAYNDLQDQLTRKGSFDAAQPMVAHDVDNVVKNTSSYGDAADYLRRSAARQMSEVPADVRQQYLDLNNQRNHLQGDFDGLRFDDDAPNKRELMMEKMDDLNNQMEALFKGPGGANLIDSKPITAQAFKDMRLSNAFQKLHNTMDMHFNHTAQMAEETGQPRTATNLGSLSRHIEQVKSQYGDVLDPVLGDQGLNHIVKLGDQIKSMGKGEAAPNSILGHAAEAFRQHMSGVRGGIALAASSPAVWAMYMAGHLTGGAAGGAAVLGSEGAFRYFRQRIATDPAFAEKFIQAAKSSTAPATAGKWLAGLAVNSHNMSQQPEEEPDAGSQ